MINIILIGCGNIGARHLQSLCQLNLSAEFHIVDPNFKNIQNAIDISNSKNNRVIHSYRNINELPNKIDLLIVATNSNIRYKIFKKLTKNYKPKFTILEKFLFQKKEDYLNANILINENNLNVWVNQNYTMQKSFIDAATHFLNSKRINMSVEGGNWGLCGNSVHYIDYFDYITDRNQNMHIKKSKFDEVIISKRKGFYEIIGEIEILTNSGSTLSLKTRNNKRLEKTIINLNDENKNKVTIQHENNNILCEFNLNGNLFSKKSQISMQSELTSVIALCLLKDQNCTLPTFSTSMKHHLLVIDEFKNFFDLNDIDTKEGVPIT